MISDLFVGKLSFLDVMPLPTNAIAWKVITFIVLLQITFSLILPYDNVIALNSAGEREWRRINSFWSCLLINLFYLMGITMGFYKGSVIYTNWTEILALCNLLSIAIAVLLYLKYQLTESFSSEPITALFCGCELSPMLFDMDMKHFITFRIALTLYPLYIISSLYHSYSVHEKLSDNLIACSVLQLTYIAKTHWLEHLHFSQLDAQLNKTGFYRIWGVLVFLPVLYLTPVTVLANHKNASLSTIPLPICLLLFIVGLCAIYITASIDTQRFSFRYANGHVKVWGKDPFFITAKYKRDNGEVTTNLLLGSGWWGLSRHLNYAFEWLTFALWTILCGSTTFLHYVPLIYLAAFLWMRMIQDETRCLAKYGHGWLQYTNRVPFLIIPSMY
ncbi:unnamed protein product [Anisakis simplex]|uniref:7-dehydrocholesterol reductase n=1 Tax=Anisakis simplex TaxID=6269 RepID=A0A3P6R1L4_ANISI|nr:unnamed protein product [Anisakis simplex]